MKLFVALFVMLFSFNSHGMGAGMCKVINEWPGCPQKHKLTVINGEGGGKYLPKTEVKIKAVASNPRQVFVVWSDPDGVIKDPKAADALVIMGDKDITVTAEFEQGPTDPCEVDPDSKECACSKDPEGIVCKPCEPNDPRPECEAPPLPDDFDWSKVKKYGGPEIGIAKDIATWEVTSQLKSVSFSGSLLRETRDEFKPTPCKDNLQGNFNACVKGGDGLYVCGSWDYEKCGGQTGGKTINNLKGEMANSFDLHRGSEICFFNSGLARTNDRNQKIRTSVKCTEWPY